MLGMLYNIFKCLKCGHQWKQRSGQSQCPKCDHLYVKWLNYEEQRKKWRVEEGWKMYW